MNIINNIVELFEKGSLKKNYKVSVLLPTYNEKDNIIPLIDELTGLFKNREFEIIVIDDDSPDETWRYVQEKGKEDKRVHLLRRIGKRELTSALNDGIAKAEGDVVVWMDSDFQHPPPKVIELLAALEMGYDAAVGSRFAFGGKDFRKIKRHLSSVMVIQGYLSRLISLVTSLLLRSSFRDWTSGFIAIKRDILINNKLRGDYGEYFMLLMHDVLKTNCKVLEIPYNLDPRKSGYSKTATNFRVLFFRGMKYLYVLLKLFIKSSKRKWRESIYFNSL